MAKETRKLRRAQERAQEPSGKDRRADLKRPLQVSNQEPPNPLDPAQLKSTFVRVGLIVGALWLVGGLIAAMSQSSWVRTTALVVPGVLSAVVVGVLVWTLNRAKKAREMAGLLRGVETAEDRRAAIERIEQTSKKNDPSALFARAQLEMQEDPKKALATLESIDLSKVMGPVADEARTQRAMIHLTLGQVSLARQLVDNVDLKRHQDPRSRAMMAAIASEAWARSGEPTRAIETLDVFDMESSDLEALRPQLLRAYAFAYAHVARTKDLRRVLRSMVKIDARLLGGFLQGKGHPLLQKEAKKMLEQSGVVPRRMQVQRMR